MVVDPLLLKKIRKSFVRLFDGATRMRMLVHDAGLDAGIAAGADAIEERWYLVLEEAKKHDRVRALVEQALDVFPADAELREIAEALLGDRVAVLRKDEKADEVVLKPSSSPRVDFVAIEVVLRDLGAVLPERYDIIEPVGMEKLNENDIGEFNRMQIAQGMRFSAVVARYFASHHDEELGERIATSYRKRYRALRDMGFAPRETYHRLYQFTYGQGHGTPQVVAAVLAYFFERCDIFENAPLADILCPEPHGLDGILPGVTGNTDNPATIPHDKKS